jgi:hypothetical protein
MLPPVLPGGNLISVIRGGPDSYGTVSQSSLDAHRRGPVGSLAHSLGPSATPRTPTFPSGMERAQHCARAAFFRGLHDGRYAFRNCSFGRLLDEQACTGLLAWRTRSAAIRNGIAHTVLGHCAVRWVLRPLERHAEIRFSRAGPLVCSPEQPLIESSPARCVSVTAATSKSIF